jgi:hypothetical protein
MAEPAICVENATPKVTNNHGYINTPYHKQHGYRSFTELIGMDQSFFMVRKFKTLNTRVALCLQDKIVQIAERLDDLDKLNIDPRVGDVHNGTFRYDHDLNRKKLIEEDLIPSLTQYSKFANARI